MSQEKKLPRKFIYRGDIKSVENLATERHLKIFDIAFHLENFGMSAWTHPLMIFLRTYDGIEKYCSRCDPILEFHDKLVRISALGSPVLAGSIAVNAAELSVLNYHAAWIASEKNEIVNRWDPFSKCFREFLSDPVIDAEFALWQEPLKEYDRESVRLHLLSHYIRINGFE